MHRRHAARMTNCISVTDKKMERPIEEENGEGNHGKRMEKTACTMLLHSVVLSNDGPGLRILNDWKSSRLRESGWNMLLSQQVFATDILVERTLHSSINYEAVHANLRLLPMS
jgi:hypothetical protein